MSDAKDTAKQQLERAKTQAQVAVEKAKGEAERTRTTVQDTVKEVKAAIDWVGGGPASSPEEAEQQITELRGRLDRDIATLRGRVPAPAEISDQTRRALGVAAGSAAAVAMSVAGLKRRGARRQRQRDLHDHAMLIARELARIDFARILDEVAREFEDADSGRRRGRWLLALLGFAGGLGATFWARQQAAGTPAGEQPLT